MGSDRVADLENPPRSFGVPMMIGASLINSYCRTWKVDHAERSI